MARRRTPAGARVSGSRRTTTRALPGEPARTRTPGAAGSQALELGERRLDLADELARRDVEQAVVTRPATDRDDRAVGEEPVRRTGRRPTPGRRTRPPSAPAVRAAGPRPAGTGSTSRSGPRRGGGSRPALHSGWTTDSSGPPAARSGSPSDPSAAIVRDAQAGRLPGHARVVPLEPRQPVARGRDPRRRHEVHARSRGRADRARRRARRRRSRCVARPRPNGPRGPRRTAAGPASKRRSAYRHGPAGVIGTGASAPGSRRYRRPSATSEYTTTPPATVYDPPPYSWTRVRTETDSGTTASAALGTETHEHLASGFGRTGLQPVQVVAVDPGVVQADLVGDQVLDPDRTPPGPVRGDGGFGHRPVQVPCCQDET